MIRKCGALLINNANIIQNDVNFQAGAHRVRAIREFNVETFVMTADKFELLLNKLRSGNEVRVKLGFFC